MGKDSASSSNYLPVLAFGQNRTRGAWRDILARRLGDPQSADPIQAEVTKAMLHAFLRGARWGERSQLCPLGRASVDGVAYLPVSTSGHEEQKPAEGWHRVGPADWGLRRRSSTTGSVRLPASRLLASYQNLSAIRSRIYWTRHLWGPRASRGELRKRESGFCMRD